MQKIGGQTMSIRFRLPTKEEFERLTKCWSRFDEKKNGRCFFDEETGEKLFLPCNGCPIKKNVRVCVSSGFYWTSTECFSYHDALIGLITLQSKIDAYYFCFDSRCMNPITNLHKYYEQSVRLVSDAPFGGAIHVAGLYWKPENEEGFFSYDEAMSKFNNK